MRTIHGWRPAAAFPSGGIRMRPTRTIGCLGLLVATLPSFASPARAAVQVPDGFANEVIVPGLDEPTSLAFLPDGRILLTEQRTAKVRLVVDGHIAARDPVLVVPGNQSSFGEQGLLGIAVDP